MDIVKVALVGVISVILAIKLKGYNSEFSVYLSLMACIFILFYAFDKLSSIIDFIKQLQSSLNIDTSYIKILLKLIGISYVCEFSSSLCRDAGYNAIAGQIDMVGKLSILVVSMPIIVSLLNIINKFLS